MYVIPALANRHSSLCVVSPCVEPVIVTVSTPSTFATRSQSFSPSPLFFMDTSTSIPSMLGDYCLWSWAFIVFTSVITVQQFMYTASLSTDVYQLYTFVLVVALRACYRLLIHLPPCLTGITVVNIIALASSLSTHPWRTQYSMDTFSALASSILSLHLEIHPLHQFCSTFIVLFIQHIWHFSYHTFIFIRFSTPSIFSQYPIYPCCFINIHSTLFQLPDSDSF